MGFGNVTRMSELTHRAERTHRDAQQRLVQARERVITRAWGYLRTMPDERIDRLMRTPARHVIIGAVFSQVPGLIDPARSGTLSTSIRWRITTGDGSSEDVYSLLIDGGQARIIRGTSGPEPRATITVSATEFMRLATGNSNLLASYFNGKLVLTGNVMAVAKIVSMIRFQELLVRG